MRDLFIKHKWTLLSLKPFRVRWVFHLEVSGKQQEKHMVRWVLGGRLQVQTNSPWRKVRSREKKMYRYVWSNREDLQNERFGSCPTLLSSSRRRKNQPGLAVRTGGQGAVCDRCCLCHGPRVAQHAHGPVSWLHGRLWEHGPRRRTYAPPVHSCRQL